MASVAGLAPRDPSDDGLDADYGQCFYNQANFGGYCCEATGSDFITHNSLISQAGPCQDNPQLDPRCPGLHIHHDASVTGRDDEGNLRSKHWGVGRKMDVHWDPALFEEESYAMSSTTASVAGLAPQ